MPELSFEVYCGNCGDGCCRETLVENISQSGLPRITVSCETCQNKMDEMQEKIDELERRLNDEI